MTDMYRIYTVVNCADTCRDPDDFYYTELGCVESASEALTFMKEFIQQKFFNSDAKIYREGINYWAQESCSYGRTLKADKVVLK